MKCPYTVHRETTTQAKYAYNEDGTQKCYTEITSNRAEMIECEKENCGAWKNGKCCYSTVSDK